MPLEHRHALVFVPGFHEHPKLLAAGPLGRDLFVAGLSYSREHETDGLVPEHALPTLATYDRVYLETPGSLPGVPVQATPSLVARSLVDVGLWHPRADGYLIHDYADYQRTRAELERKREQTRERARRHRSTRGNAAVTRDRSVTAAPVPRARADGQQTARAFVVETAVQVDARAVELSGVNTGRAAVAPELERLAGRISDADERTPFVLAKLQREGLPEAAFGLALEALEQRRGRTDKPPLSSEVRYFVAALKTMQREGTYA